VIDSSAAPDQTETIVAISTPPGRGGIGIVRLSGPGALLAAAQLVSLRAPLEHAHAVFARVFDPLRLGKILDDAVVTAFFAPHSYTGEDLVEIAAHGSPVVLEALVRAALSIEGIRLAAPGEFTQRAFLSGKLDLTQAEAVADLIAAQTLEQVRSAAQQMGGAMSRRVAPAKESLLRLIALLEAGMDFASGELDDVDVVPPAQIRDTLYTVTAPLQQLAESFRRGQILRDGAAIALVGRPNAGKSSLFNRLLERERAIVTPVPGTTRDTVEESLSLGGIPLRLIDTAGLRGETLAGQPDQIDEAERQGMARSHEALADADLILLVHDASLPLEAEEERLMASLAGRPHVVIWNKIDLVEPTGADQAVDVVRTSALTGAGLADLRHAVLHALQAEGSFTDAGALNNLRQQESVTATLAALQAAVAAIEAAMPHEVLLLDLHTALQALDALTGATTTDDILGRIFSTFCIGK
jgi:tRNA modification GTPase